MTQSIDMPSIPRTKYVYYESTFLHSRRDEIPKSAWLFLRLGKRAERRTLVTFGPASSMRQVYAAMRKWIRATKAKPVPRAVLRAERGR